MKESILDKAVLVLVGSYLGSSKSYEGEATRRGEVAVGFYYE